MRRNFWQGWEEVREFYLVGWLFLWWGVGDGVGGPAQAPSKHGLVPSSSQASGAGGKEPRN